MQKLDKMKEKKKIIHFHIFGIYFTITISNYRKSLKSWKKMMDDMPTIDYDQVDGSKKIEEVTSVHHNPLP